MSDSDIQRYDDDGYEIELAPVDDGIYVLYAAHVAALLTQDQQHMEELAAAVAAAVKSAVDDGFVLGKEAARDAVVEAMKKYGFDGDGYALAAIDALGQTPEGMS